MEPPKRLFLERERPDDGESLPEGNLKVRLNDRDLRDSITEADFIMGVNPRTGESAGLFYSVAQFRRIERSDPTETAEVLSLEVDPETDDVDVLCEMVKAIKGSHCFSPAANE
jgi:hypothetical protein